MESQKEAEIQDSKVDYDSIKDMMSSVDPEDIFIACNALISRYIAHWTYKQAKDILRAVEKFCREYTELEPKRVAGTLAGTYHIASKYMYKRPVFKDIMKNVEHNKYHGGSDSKMYHKMSAHAKIKYLVKKMLEVELNKEKLSKLQDG